MATLRPTVKTSHVRSFNDNQSNQQVFLVLEQFTASLYFSFQKLSVALRHVTRLRERSEKKSRKWLFYHPESRHFRPWAFLQILTISCPFLTSRFSCTLTIGYSTQDDSWVATNPETLELELCCRVDLNYQSSCILLLLSRFTYRLALLSLIFMFFTAGRFVNLHRVILQSPNFKILK